MVDFQLLLRKHTEKACGMLGHSLLQFWDHHKMIRSNSVSTLR